MTQTTFFVCSVLLALHGQFHSCFIFPLSRPSHGPISEPKEHWPLLRLPAVMLAISHTGLLRAFDSGEEKSDLVFIRHLSCVSDPLVNTCIHDLI